MKKSFLIILSILLMAAFTGCGDDAKKKTTDSDLDKVADSDSAVDEDVVPDSAPDTEATVDENDVDSAGDEDLTPDTMPDAEIITDEDAVEIVIYDNQEIVSPLAITKDSIIRGTLYVKAALTIGNCAKIKMGKSARIVVSDNGSIKTEGTSECQVVFTSEKTTPAKGDWTGIEIENSASGGNSFKYTVFEYAGYPNYGVVWVEADAEAAFENTSFKHISESAIMFENGAIIPKFSGNSFDDLTGYPIKIFPENIKSISPIVVTNTPKAAVKVISGNVETAGTWKNLSVPYETETLFIKAPLTIEKCTTLKMNNNAEITVKDSGSLITKGEADCLVTFTSSKPVPTKGDWSRIDFYNTSSADNSLEYTVIEYAKGDSYGSLWIEDSTSISIKNTVFRHILNNGIMFEDDVQVKAFTNNSFDDLGGYPISTYPENIRHFSPVVVTNTANNFVSVYGGDVKTNAYWKNIGIHFKIADLYIKEPLEVEEGIHFYMLPDKGITVLESGTLTLSGTVDNRIKIMSSKASPAEGDWSYIEIYATSGAANSFSYTDIMHGGGTSGTYGQLWLDENATLDLDNVVFSEGKRCDISLAGGADLNPTASTYDICLPL